MESGDRLGLAAIVAATTLGLVYMTAGGAPPRYLILNAAALAIGMVGFLAIRRFPWRVDAGNAALAIGAALLATAFFGIRVEGAARWVVVGGLLLQPSLLLLPALCVLATRAGMRALPAVAMASVAMALQPDRAMSGALVAAMLVLWLGRRDRSHGALLTIAALGFAVTMARADTLPAMLFVDRILFTGFAISPLAGIAVWAGAALLVLPAVRGDIASRVHGATWFAIVAAALLGNYPTPVVGYGGSAIIGYLLALAVLPIAHVSAGSIGRGDRRGSAHRPRDLRFAI